VYYSYMALHFNPSTRTCIGLCMLCAELLLLLHAAGLRFVIACEVLACSCCAGKGKLLLES
jgi:hypothetical protein